MNVRRNNSCECISFAVLGFTLYLQLFVSDCIYATYKDECPFDEELLVHHGIWQYTMSACPVTVGYTILLHIQINVRLEMNYKRTVHAHQALTC